MANGNRQFDPVAASATAALNATQRSLQSFQGNLNAPPAPAQSQAFTQTRSILSTISSFSPANVLATGQTPSLPGMQGQNPLQNLPGLQGQNPLQNLPGLSGMQGDGGPPLPPTPSGMPGPDMDMGNGGGGGGRSNGGSSSRTASSSRGSRSRTASESRT